VTRSVFLALAACLAIAAAGGNAVSEEQASRAWTIPSTDAIRALLAERMAHNGVGVVVGVIDRNGRRVIGYGRFAADDARVPDGETVFQIGSVTKAFTTLLLAEMVARGEVKLEDPAAKYLPEGVTMPAGSRPITLLDLATHRSGLPSMPTNYDLHARPDPYEAYTVEELHAFLSGYTLPREPGAEAAYSNLGVALLGRLLARRAGMEYEALLTERVLEPLGMSDTSIALRADQERRLAPGHDRYLHPVRTWEMKSLPASGSLRSTANDMLEFIAAYLDEDEAGRLAAAIELQLRDHLPDVEGRQPLGWGVRADGVVQHAGGKQGYRSAVVFDPARGLGAVVLANARTYDQPIDLARHLVTGEPLPPAPAAPAPRARVDVAHAILDRYAGTYRFEDGSLLEVARMGGHLLVHTPGNGISEFFATAPNAFFLDTGNDELELVVDGGGGAVTRLVLYGDGRDGGEGTRAARVRE
jgi:CubicO group peptidase (beta-lactamase class C family)